MCNEPWCCLRGPDDPMPPTEHLGEMQCVECRAVVRIPPGWFATWDGALPVQADGVFRVPDHTCDFSWMEC